MLIKVTNSRQLKRFVSMPANHYKGDPFWIPAMVGADLSSFDPKLNSALGGMNYELYFYEIGKEVVGRVGMFISAEFNRLHGKKVAFFGLFECVNDMDVARSLLDEVERFAGREGMSEVLGPVDITPNYTMGLLIEGFARPTIMTPYSKSFYRELIEGAGYEKAMDLYAYIHPREKGVPERVGAAAPVLKKRYPNIIIRSLKQGRPKDRATLQEVYNSAFSDNWAFLPLGDAEAGHLLKYISKKGDPELAYMAYDIKEPVGLLIALPDPRLKGRLRLSVLGIKPGYRGKGIETRLAARLLQDAFYLKRYKEVEYSLILENNEPMNRFIKKESGCEVSRVYRVYSKQLDQLP